MRSSSLTARGRSSPSDCSGTSAGSSPGWLAMRAINAGTAALIRPTVSRRETVGRINAAVPALIARMANQPGDEPAEVPEQSLGDDLPRAVRLLLRIDGALVAYGLAEHATVIASRRRSSGACIA